MQTTGKAVKKGSMLHVSIILPAHKEYPHYKQDKMQLKKLIHDVEMRMNGVYDKKVTANVVSSLNKMKSEIDFTHLQNGLVIHYSPMEQKIYHLPFSPSEKLIIDDSFEIRDMVYKLKTQFDYYILVLTEGSVRAIKVMNRNFSELKVDEFPLGMDDTGGKSTTRVKSFSLNTRIQHVSDSKAYQEVKVDKYLRDIDKIVSEHPELKNLSQIICAPLKLAAQFKKISGVKSNRIGTINGNYEKQTPKSIVTMCEKLLKESHLDKQDKLLKQIEKESKKKLLAWGIRDVKLCAHNGMGRLLIVEKDYAPSTLFIKENLADKKTADLVDDIIEEVVEKGGDVEFVENGKLGAYDRIVMIKRY